MSEQTTEELIAGLNEQLDRYPSRLGSQIRDRLQQQADQLTTATDALNAIKKEVEKPRSWVGQTLTHETALEIYTQDAGLLVIIEEALKQIQKST